MAPVAPEDENAAGERWVVVRAADGIAPGELRGALVEGHRLCIGRTRAGRAFAMADPCPHAGGSLSQGIVDRDEVVCPLHAWGFHIETGACAEDARCPATIYRVRDDTTGLAVDLASAFTPAASN